VPVAKQVKAPRKKKEKVAKEEYDYEAQRVYFLSRVLTIILMSILAFKVHAASARQDCSKSPFFFEHDIDFEGLRNKASCAFNCFVESLTLYYYIEGKEKEGLTELLTDDHFESFMIRMRAMSIPAKLRVRGPGKTPAGFRVIFEMSSTMTTSKKTTETKAQTKKPVCIQLLFNSLTEALLGRCNYVKCYGSHYGSKERQEGPRT
jgi:hypothetical protein